MKRLLMYLSILFTILTIVGAAVVIISGGNINPIIAIVPLVMTIICNNAYRFLGKKEQK